MIDFTDEVVLVTGAGRGLGRLYALDCARRGASVVVNDIGASVVGDGRDAQVADDVVAEIEKAGGTAVASHDSVVDAQGAAAIVATALERFGRLDAVISNAGIFQTVDFENLAAEDWRRMLAVHLDGGFHLGQAAYPRNEGAWRRSIRSRCPPRVCSASIRPRTRMPSIPSWSFPLSST